MNIPITVLIEALECLNIARKNGPAGQYARLLTASSDLDYYVTKALQGVNAGVLIPGAPGAMFDAVAEDVSV